MKLIIFLFLFISITKCVKINDLCYPKNGTKFKCKGIYNYNCGGFMCTKNQNNCEILSIFLALKGKVKTKYESFMTEVKECSESSKYKWNAKDVCVRTKLCIKPFIHRIWSNKIILAECKCIGKYKYRCNSNYCGFNKLACEGISQKFSGIKRCF